jgi:hypothetical protein
MKDKALGLALWSTRFGGAMDLSQDRLVYLMNEHIMCISTMNYVKGWCYNETTIGSLY